jgi:predicted acyl esterase
MPINTPGYWFVSWFDVSSGPNIELFNHVRNAAKDKSVADNQYLVIAPVLHCSYKRATEDTKVGQLSVGDARLNYDELTWSWFDMHLINRKSTRIT